MEAGGAPVIIIRDNHRLRPDPVRTSLSSHIPTGETSYRITTQNFTYGADSRNKPECATVMEEKEREVIQLQREPLSR